MENIARVGIDLAKKVFHVTAVDYTGAMVERKAAASRAAIVSGVPADGLRGGDGSVWQCHHWGRLAAWHGHEVRLMSPQYVGPYI